MVSELRRHRNAVVLAFLFITALAQNLLAAQVYIDVDRKRGATVRLAISDFTFKKTDAQTVEDKQLTKSLTEALAFDLGFSGFFEILDNKELIKELTEKETVDGKPDWKAWKMLGTDSVVRGEYYINQNGEMIVEGRLYDIARKERIIGARYTGSKSILRKMVHRFADQTVYRFSGGHGIAETRIAFVSKVNGSKELVVSDYDGRNMLQLTNEKSIVLSPSWSPFGDKIAFTTYRYKNPDIYGIDLLKGSRFAISKKIGLNSAPTWSPDGKTIAFSMAKRGNSDIYSIGTDGKNLKQLTTERSIETSPTFSPDGKRIAFVSDFSGGPQIYIMDKDGRHKSRFTFSGSYNGEPAWSPKGEMIAYSSISDYKFNIHLKRVTGKFEKQLTVYNGSNESPSWSPDGRHIAFTSTRNGTKQLFIMNSNGERQTQITSLQGGAYSPEWAPAEKRK